MRSTLARCALTLVAIGAVVGTAQAATAGGGTRGDSVVTVRQATAKYHDPAAALADGYLPTDICVSSPAGAMGYHYVNPTLLQQPIDIKRPAILVYQPDGDGGRRLVAAEYFKADADQDLTTDGDRPILLNTPFDGPMLGHEPGMPIHYDLHVWIWQHNPVGMLDQFNPSGTC